MTVSEPDTSAASRPGPLRSLGPWGMAAVILFCATALGSRFYRLGERPLHHDESIHAYQSYTLAKDGNWRYDPAYHGPFLYYANALVYKLAGASNTTARLLPAVFGILLMAFAWPLSRWIGPQAAGVYALLILVSPHFAYFSRFIREDLYSLVFTLGTILAFRRFLETDRGRFLTASAVSFALAGVTKENAYMTGVLFVAFGLWLFLEQVLGQKPRTAALRTTVRVTVDWVSRRFVALLCAGIVFLLIWALMYTAFGRYPADWFAIGKAVKYWMGQHAIARIPGPWYYYFPHLAYYATGTLLAALCLLRRRDLRQDPFFLSLLCGLGGLALYAVVKDWTTGPQLGKVLPPVAFKALSPLILAAAAFAALVPLWSARSTQMRPDPFLRFLVFWALGSLAIYSWAREKVPWLGVHPLLPITILAAISIADLWRDRRQTAARVALAAIALLLAVNAGGMLLACFRYGAHDVEKEPKHAEMLAYVQTSRDLIRALGPLEAARQRVPSGQPLVTVAGEATWPLSWYLRDVPTRWASKVEDASTPIIVADWNPEGILQKQLQERYDAKRVPIRAWWFPEWVKAGQAQGAQHLTPRDFFRWWLFHEIWSPIGSQDAMFYVRKDLLYGSGPLEPLRLAVQDTSARDYPSAASTIPAAREWGGPGTGPGLMAEPRGLAADARGNLYVVDTKNHRIQVFDTGGQFVRQLGSQGSQDGQFKEPCGLAVDLEGHLWVADTWNHRIVHIGPDGKFLGAFGGGDRAFFGPRAIVASSGVLYVADTGNKRIVRFDRKGNFLSQWGGDGTGPRQFIEPVGLAADPSGKIWVADTGNHRVQVFDSEGKFLRQFPVFGWKDFYTEPYLVIGPSESLFVTDSSSGRIAHYDLSGALRRSWKPERDFKLPTGIALDPYGRLFVSDRGTHRIFSWGLAEVTR